MDKPIELVRYEFLEEIVKLINNANLPAFVMLDIFKDLEDNLGQLAAAQLEEAKKKYEAKGDEVNEDI